MRLDLPPAAKTALDLLTGAGFEAWLVGGWVRDAVLGRPSGDMDIATAALPEETRQVFSGYRTLDTGLRHGTLTLLIDGEALEITTFRSDGDYLDHRRPDRVRFVTSLKEDLARRDFTINAMAWHPDRGLMDPFCGQEDLKQRLLRAVGEPRQRFSEDALRILRALRFACQLGFDIEERTLGAMMNTPEGLNPVSAERIAAELNKALMGAYAADALRKYPRVLFLALPELAPMLHTPQRTPFHRYDVWEHSLRTLEAAPLDLPVKWAALFHDSGKPHTATIGRNGTTHFRGHQAVSARLTLEALERLKQPKALQETCHTLVKYHDERVGPDNLRLYLSRLGYPLTRQLLRLQWADLKTHADLVSYRLPQIEGLLEETLRLEQEGAPLFLKDLAVNGADLMALGFAQDARLGQALQSLLDKVLKGELANSREELLAAAAQLPRQ